MITHFGAATPDITTIVDSYTSFTPMITVLLAFVGIAVSFGGLVKVLRSDYDSGGGWFFVIGGVILAGAGFFFPWLLQLLNETDPEAQPTGESTQQPTATPEPSQVPETVQPPADLTGLWVTLLIIVAAILAVLLIWLIIHLSSRARRSVRAAREEAEALRALQEARAATWQSFHDRLDELLRKILHAETDWDTLFFMPALSDSSVPETYEMLLAMRTATTLRDTAGELPGNLADDADLTKLPFPRAVADFALAWDAAERNAKRIGQKNVPLKERRLIKQIRTLLDLAENSAASDTERNLAYKRAQGLIEELESIHIPAKAMEQLEERKLLALTRTPEMQTSR